jgi:hypothetical protein
MSVRPISWLTFGGILGAALLVAGPFALGPGRVHRDTPAQPRIVEPRTADPEPGEAGPTDSPAHPRFTDVHDRAGLTVSQFNGADGRFRLVETMGTGVAVFDYDNDGWLDVFVVQGCLLPPDPAQKQHTARLYRNRHDGSFADLTDKAGVGFNGYGQGVAVGDYDADGNLDLYISALGSGVLYRNLGDGTFTDVTARAGLTSTGWGTSCAFGDLDADGDLDLYVCHYLADAIDSQGNPTVQCNASPGQLGYCPPDAFPPEPDLLYRNNGDGTFTDYSKVSNIATVPGKGLGLAIADLDDDGRLDIFVANDQTPNFLFHNLGGLKFEEVAVRYGVAYSESGQLRSGMGVALGDYDGDGRPDLLVTNFYEEGDTLYSNVSPGNFQVTTARARLAAPSRGTLGFGSGFLDIDNDGYLDLFVTNGHLNDVRPLGMPYQMHAQLFSNDRRGGFLDLSARAGPYFKARWLGRGAAFGDLDNDGDLDILVTHIGQPPAVLINESEPRGHFLTLSLQPRLGGRPCIGARVIAEIGDERLVRVLAGGTSYLSASDPRVHIGLGRSLHIDRLEIVWPSGMRQEWKNVDADRFLEAREGSATLQLLSFPENRSH